MAHTNFDHAAQLISTFYFCFCVSLSLFLGQILLAIENRGELRSEWLYKT